MRDVFHMIGVLAPFVTGLAGFKQWPWWIPLACALASTVWYVLFTGLEVASRSLTRSVPRTVWYFAQVPAFHAMAWLIGYAMARASH